MHPEPPTDSRGAPLFRHPWPLVPPPAEPETIGSYAPEPAEPPTRAGEVMRRALRLMSLQLVDGITLGQLRRYWRAVLSEEIAE